MPNNKIPLQRTSRPSIYGQLPRTRRKAGNTKSVPSPTDRAVLLMIEKGIDKFIEIGPGKVLSGLIKRANNTVKVSAINTEEDIKLININE